MNAPSMLSAAFALAARGFRVFPVREPSACSCKARPACDHNGKRPRVKNWPYVATTDLDQVREWWCRWPGANVGIACGGPSRLVVIDVDGREGRAALEALADEHGPLPTTLTARTGRREGGAHLYHRCPDDLDIEAVRPCAGKIAPHVDQRGPGGFVVAPPSVHASGAVYAFEDDEAPLADLPRWLFDLATREKERPAPAPQASTPRDREATRGDSRRPDASARAVAWLAAIEPSIQGQNGSGALAFAACGLTRGLALTDSEAFGALAGAWNQRCSPPWSTKELVHAIHYQRENGRRFAVGELLDASRPAPRRPARAPAPCPVVDVDAAEAAAVQEVSNMRDENAGEPDMSFPPDDDAPPSSRPDIGAQILAAVRGGRIARPAELLEALPKIQGNALLDAAARMLDAGEIDTAGGVLSEGQSSAEGAGLRAILALIAGVPNAQRTNAASSPAVLLFASFHRKGTPAWERLKLSVQGLKVAVRGWSALVDDLRPSPPSPPPAESDARRSIRIDPSRLDLAVDGAIDALRADDNLYCRGGELASLLTITAATCEDVEQFPFLSEGAPCIREVSPATLQERLCRVARFELERDHGWKVHRPPSDLIAATLARGAWPGVRPLKAIIETPTIKPLRARHGRPLVDGGAVLDTPGHDNVTGYLYMPPRGVSFDAVPENPTKEDAQRALSELNEIFVDFPFETDAGRSVAVAAILSFLARPAIDESTPIFAFDAAARGTGKTLIVDAIYTVALGRMSAKMTFPIDPQKADEEVRKILTSVGLKGASAVFFDNIKPGVPFGGPSLESVATAGIYEARLLGTHSTPTLKWDALMFVTGNNLRVTPDMRRRTMNARLVSKHQDPAHRPPSDYRYPDRIGHLLPWILSERGRLVCAGLTVLRAFIVAGMPKVSDKRAGSFDAWVDLVANAIVWAGGANPLDCLLDDAEQEGSEETAALAVVLRDLPRTYEGTTGITAKALVARLWTAERVRGQEVPPDGLDDLREAVETLAPPGRMGGVPDARAVGKAFGDVLRDVPHNGHKLTRGPNASGGVARWVVREV